ncbi:SpoIIE family protein phosphatase [bacterium]|nr:SpoIIE family protein phosphatase [bacterium]
MPTSSLKDLVDSTQARVLVVDDNPVNSALLKTLLERDRIKCTLVSSGADALDEFRRTNFDLVLLDIEMPGISGLDVLRQLRKRQTALAFLPVMLVTGRTDMESRIEGLEAGATDFISKPFDPAELGARVRNHIQAKRLYDRLMVTNTLLKEERAKIFEAQVALLPSSMPVRQGLRFGAGYQASSVASGDYYDVIERSNGNILLAVADVSGHGIASAMQMSILRATLRARAAHGESIEAILAELNAILRHSLDDYSFVTFYLAEFNQTSGMLNSVSAGHHSPLCQDLQTGEISELVGETCCPLGLEQDLDIVVVRHQLQPGQRLIVYTDGLIEQTNRAGKYFELDGVRSCLYETDPQDPQRAVDKLLSDLHRFHGDERPKDDVTVLVMDVIKTAQ